MSTSQSRPQQTRKQRPPKSLLDYPMQLAFDRIEFYLRVLDAHYEQLGTARKAKEEDARG